MNAKKWTKRTVALIESGKRIVLRRDDAWYLHSWTNIAGGPDVAQWGRVESALEIFNLQWAFTIAPLYNCKVYSVGQDGRETLEKR